MQKNIYLFSTSSHPDAIHINSLDIKLLHPKINFSQYDYFIITSKQAVNALAQYEQKEFLQTKALCISQQSAKSFQTLGGTVLEIGSGYGDTLTEIIEKYPKTTRWLYLRAKVVASNAVQTCQTHGYTIDESIVYESDCSKEIQNVQTTQNAVLIFTSPSSVVCFLKNNSIEDNHEVIVIGKTTAKALPKSIKYQISQETTIMSCLEMIQS